MKVFSSSLVIFVIALGTNSAVNAVECPEGQENEISFLPSPVDCSKYYVCVHSEPVEMNCPEGLWFNSELNVCDFSENVACGADCQEPWVRPGSSVACYTTGQSKMNFNEAIAFCDSMGGALAEPRSDFETESIMSTINTSPSYWIGLSDRKDEGDFRWLSDNSELTYSNWKRNEPNNASGGQDCVQLWADKAHKWDDLQCNRNKNSKNIVTALCQK